MIHESSMQCLHLTVSLHWIDKLKHKLVKSYRVQRVGGQDIIYGSVLFVKSLECNESN